MSWVRWIVRGLWLLLWVRGPVVFLHVKLPARVPLEPLPTHLTPVLILARVEAHVLLECVFTLKCLVTLGADTVPFLAMHALYMLVQRAIPSEPHSTGRTHRILNPRVQLQVFPQVKDGNKCLLALITLVIPLALVLE